MDRRVIKNQPEFQQGLLLSFCQRAPSGEKVRSKPSCAHERLSVAPPGNARMIARSKHTGHFPAAEFRRPGVLRMLKEPVGKALHHRGLGVAHNPRNEASNRLSDGHGRHFSPTEDNITNGKFPVRQVLVDSLVEALVASAHQRETTAVDEYGSKFLGDLLGEPSASRSEKKKRSVRLSLRQRRLDRFEHWSGRKNHAGAPAERRIIHGFMDPDTESTQVVRSHVKHAAGSRLSQQAR